MSDADSLDDTRVVRRPNAQIGRLRLCLSVRTTESAFAALQYGADNLLIHMKGLADDNGLTEDEFRTVLGEARRHTRNVIVRQPRLLRHDEIPEAMDVLACLEELGVNAIETSDLATWYIVREHFPKLSWHAGAGFGTTTAECTSWLRRLGFERVALKPGTSPQQAVRLNPRANTEVEWTFDAKAPIDLLQPDGTDLRETLQELIRGEVRFFRVPHVTDNPHEVAAVTQTLRELIDGGDPPVTRNLDLLRDTDAHRDTLEKQWPIATPTRSKTARLPLRIEVILKVNPDGGALDDLGMPGLIQITGRHGMVELVREYPAKLLFAASQPMTEERLGDFFNRTGASRFELRNFSGIIPAGVFVPAGEINDARRRFLAEMEDTVNNARKAAVQDAAKDVSPELPETSKATGAQRRFRVLVADPSLVEALPLDHIAEVTLLGDPNQCDDIIQVLAALGDKARVALPREMNEDHKATCIETVSDLYRSGQRKFQVSGVCGLEILTNASGIRSRNRFDTSTVLRRAAKSSPRSGRPIFEPRIPDFASNKLDITGDFALAAETRAAVIGWFEQGIQRLTSRPGRSLSGIAPLLAEFGRVLEVVLYRGGQPDFCISQHTQKLEAAGASQFRLDFTGRDFTRDEVREICEIVMNAGTIDGSAPAQYE